jgi:hypothetical protein
VGGHDKLVTGSPYAQGHTCQTSPSLHRSDDAGGAAAFDAASDEEARAVVAADPAVTSGVFVAELHPWRLVDWAQHVKK